MSNPTEYQVVVIGAGPSGAVAAAHLKQQGISVLIIERETFPRFSIGESLLPHCMSFLDEAGMLDAITSAGFQRKDGAAFCRDGQYVTFDFEQKSATGPASTFQVKRAVFDDILARQAEKMGVEIRYQHSVKGIKIEADYTLLEVEDDTGQLQTIQCQFVLDASGFGRVLPRLLDLETPSDFPVRKAVFTHYQDGIAAEDPFLHNGTCFDRNKILIVPHEQHHDIWLWIIPFSDATTSIGVVAEQKYYDALADLSLNETLDHFIDTDPALCRLLKNRQRCQNAREITGYSANVKSLFGERFALLGNAGEFLDPVFSSGVTIALKSANLCAPLVVRSLKGESVDWEQEYAIPLRQGINAFRTYVEAWYQGGLQTVFFHPSPDPKIKAMICSILAGYAWDCSNPFALKSDRYLGNLIELCTPEQPLPASASCSPQTESLTHIEAKS
ncbi:monooxygenase, FAD-binding protein [Oleiphilus messinensis]|uniref:Monooxygenase, FAD-binding protein n=1 Tax=Oleiphilus messinensis TaxID=141451 RepID=A0A1Y0I4I0_9GAMM|nr:NAD(P)/FAD-dependent oxidoreductase [Oleiphilus messinensis]ARU55109.1 monooxygenase, FAD-binding protein [Oleiphilus messinensis]